VQPVVRLRSAVCLLGRFPALAGVDLDVREREVVLLSGGNGAGKTTLLRAIAGLVAIHSGEIEVLGHDLRLDRRTHRRELALVGHESGCYDDLTVRENVTFAARAAQAPPESIDRAIDALSLGALAATPHGRLSAGQRRRLSISVALARAPRLLLLDEPHAGLDADGRTALDEILRGASEAGLTVIVASHELDRARALATREVVVSTGQAHGALEVARAPEPAPA
jgi:heme ABC exporter ATP-binding subunit CcmA